MKTPVDIQAYEADPSYVAETYGFGAPKRVFEAGMFALNTYRGLARNLVADAPDQLASTAAELKILFGVSGLSPEELEMVADTQQETVVGHLNDGQDLAAAYVAAPRRVLVGDRLWSEDDEHRMFEATEARIADRLSRGSRRAGFIEGLNESLFALRVLSGKSYEHNPTVRDHLRRHSQIVDSGISTPANQKGFDHIYWPSDWDDGPAAARARILAATAISFDADGIVIID